MTEKQDRYIPPLILDNPLRRLEKSPLKFIGKYLRQGMAVADIGSGPGYFTVKLSSLVGSQGTVTAIDPDQKTVERLRAKLVNLNIGNVRTLISSGSHIPGIEDNSIDFVFSHLMICCMSQHREALTEMMRILKPGAMAFVSVTRTLPGKDPRNVYPAEWGSILQDYHQINNGGTMIYRWALLQK